MASPLANAIEFLKNFGLFDVVLPFLLVFAIVFAILEKTRILGEEDGKPKKNLNSMVAFTIALLVVATNAVVTAINKSLPNIVLLLVTSVSFLMLIGVFWKTGEIDFKKEHENWYKFFVVLMFLGVALIFMNSLYLSDGQSWLNWLVNYIINSTGSTVSSSIILLLIIVGAIVYITRTPTQSDKGGK